MADLIEYIFESREPIAPPGGAVRVVRSIRVWVHRVRRGADPGDARPGEEGMHLRGAARRRAILRGEIDPDGMGTTRGPAASDDSGRGPI